MSAKRQQRRRNVEDEPRYVVGMDAHSKKLAISIWDWSDRFNACLHREIKCVDIEAMVKTYERHVDLDSITIIEASTNSADLKRRLNEAGYRAEVVRSDTIANKERKRRICDIQDAQNLALAYVKGDIDEFVWTPSDTYAEYRDIMFAYRDTSKEVTRVSNRIWSICSRKGYKLPIRGGKAKADTLRATIRETNITGFAREQLEMLLDDYDRLFKRKEELSQKIAEIVLSNPRMLRLMQLQGVNYKGAFALEAAVEDPRRFSKASKLAAYGGFSPIVDSSGDEEERAKKHGGLKKPLDGEGRQDVKFFFTEAGQSVLTSCDDQPREAAQQGRLRNRAEASHLRMAHPPGRSHAESRQRGLLQTEDANLPPDDKRQAHARAWLRDARPVRGHPGGADLRKPSHGRGEDGRLRWAQPDSLVGWRAPESTGNAGRCPTPIRGTRSP